MTTDAAAPVSASANPFEQFQWTPQPQAEALVRELVEDFLGRCPGAAELAGRMKDETGTRFTDWVDAISLPRDPGGLEQFLRDAGFREEQPAAEPAGGETDGEGFGRRVFGHPGGIFPRVIFGATTKLRAAVRVESVVDFASANHCRATIQGDPLSPLRWLYGVAESPDAALDVLERHGTRRYGVPPPFGAEEAVSVLSWSEVFRTRDRTTGGEPARFQHARDAIDGAIMDIGVDRGCDLFFAAEREYWQRRNRAAQVQKARQDRLGLGWANHDHHTYRSSREHFARMIGVFEKLGFRCRERFYAGREAGWGAQVLEQATTGIVVFADVDLSPDELFQDFAHEPLPPRQELGTVGLWCALHGESFLEAGMHHLECQFDFESLKRQLEAEAGIRTMKPFTNFPHLRQAFTEGEVWPVPPARIERLLASGQITDEQAKTFREKGALGSHLENLERNEGFKGFNQTGVSEIIARTDPRKN